MENIQYRLVLADGNTIDVNVDNAEDIFEAAPEIKESILAGDIRRNNVPIQLSDVLGIEDING